MNMPPAMIELFLRSAKAPPAVIEMYQLFVKQGFEKLGFLPMSDDDPAWARIVPDPERNRKGFWLQMSSDSSRMTMAVFIEGADDAIIKKLEGIRPTGGDSLLSLPAPLVGAVD